jgi:nucleotide-binding universal stress UspA family protein
MKTILVGLDDSPRAPHVLEAAIAVAQNIGATLHLYRAVSLPRELPTLALAKSPGEIAELLQRLANESLVALVQRVPAACRGETHVTLAVPWQGICQAAHDLGAELVVIGSHGYGGLDRLLGTTASKVVNHCEKSVLVVR